MEDGGWKGGAIIEEVALCLLILWRFLGIIFLTTIDTRIDLES